MDGSVGGADEKLNDISAWSNRDNTIKYMGSQAKRDVCVHHLYLADDYIRSGL